MSPEVPLPVKNPGLNIAHGSWRLVSPHLKWHFYWFSRFAGLTSETDKQTDHATLLCSNSPHLALIAALSAKL